MQKITKEAPVFIHRRDIITTMQVTRFPLNSPVEPAHNITNINSLNCITQMGIGVSPESFPSIAEDGCMCRGKAGQLFQWLNMNMVLNIQYLSDLKTSAFTTE